MNTLDVFTGTFSVSGGTLYLGSDFTAPTGTAFAFSGSGSSLSYTGGGPFTLALPSTATFTRFGLGSSYVYDHLTSAGSVTVSSGTLQFQSGTIFTNSGTATVTGTGSTLYLIGLANSGTLAADSNGLIQLAGSFTTGNLGTVTLASGGAIKLTGSLNNASANLTAPSGGAYTLAGGTITGGSITSGAIATSSTNSTLDGATISGNLTLNSGDVLSLKNGAGADGTTTVNNATLYLATHLSAAANSAYVFTGNGSSLSYTGGGPFTFTLPSTASLTRSGAGATYVYDSVTNAGNVTVSGGSLQFQSGTTLTNSGTTTVTGSGSSLYLQGLANSGTLTVDTSGLVQLSGSFTSAGLGNITLASGGVVQLTGTLTNTSLVALAGGSLTLLGGTISGGTIAAGALAFTSSAGYLDNASLLDDLSLGTNSYVRFINGAGFTGGNATFGANAGIYWQQSGTLAGKALAFGANSYLYVSGANHVLTLDSTSTGTGQVRIYSDGSSGTSITNQGNLTNTTGTGTLYAPTLANTGTITNTAANNYLVLGSTSSGYNTSNAGGNIVVNGAGSSIYLDGNVTATGGTLTATSGQFIFRGNNTSAHLNGGNLTIASGAHAYLNGTIDASGATLAAPTSGSYELYGGTVANGTIAVGALGFTSSGGYLDNATLSDNLTLGSSTSVHFTNGAGFTGTTGTFGSNAGIYWQQVGTLANKSLSLGSGAYLYVYGANNALTLASTTSVSGSTNIYTDGSAGNALTNQGTITNTSGSSQINAHTLANTGTITNTAANNYIVIGSTANGYNTSNAGGNIVVNGTNASIYLDGNVTATGGTLTATSGQFYFRGNNTSAHLNGGNLTIASGAHAYLNGTIDASGATLAAPTSGSYELYGGTIKDGAIAAGALAFTTSGGYLSNATLTDNLTLPASAYVRFTNGAAFTGTTATLGNNAGLYWQQAGILANTSLTLGNGAYLYVSGTNSALTLASTTSVSGSANVYTDGSSGTSVTNQGTITQTNASSYGQIYAPTFTNSGSISATAGTLYLGYPGSGYNSTNASGGTITASGTNTTVYLRGNFTNSGSLVAQNSGQLIFDGTNTTGNLGSVTLSGGGRALLNGTLTNANLMAPTGGKFELYGGTLSGGTIAANALSFTTSGGYLDNVSLLDDLTLGASHFVRFINGASFTGANATLAGNAGIYWQQVGTLTNKTLTFGNGAYLYVASTNNTLTLAPGTSVSGTTTLYGDGSTGNAITNQGSITHTSGTGYLYATNFTNSGTITATGGTLYVGYSSTPYAFTNTSTGNLTVNGSTASVWLQATSTTPFNNAGNLTVQSGTLSSNSPLTNIGNIAIAAGTTFNEYSGATFTQTAGTLKIAGTFVAPTGGATISGGSVTGTGNVTGDMTFAAGTLEPGGSIGTLTFTGNLTLTGGATTIMELGAATNDHVTVSGTGNSLVFAGNLDIVATSTAFAPGQTWNLFTFGSHSGSFANLSLPYTSSGWVWDTSQLTSTGNLTLTSFVPIVVPEPSTYALLASGLGLLFVARRRWPRRS